MLFKKLDFFTYKYKILYKLKKGGYYILFVDFTYIKGK